MLENDNVANSRTPSGPYTNLIGFNLVYLRGIPLLHKFIESIKVSNKIYQQRWGDLPLWGEAIHYILGESKLRVDSTLKYFHESHHLYVNT